MKKNKMLAVLMAGAMVVGSTCVMAANTATTRVRVFINSQLVQFVDGEPFVDSNNRTQIPVRFVSEALGAKVEWEPTAKRVTIIDEGREIILNIDQKKIMVNGQGKTLDTAAKIKDDRTFVPLRFVSEGLGAEVTWDPVGRNVYITTGKAVQLPQPEPKVEFKGEGYTNAGGFIVPKENVIEMNESECQWILGMESSLQIRVDKREPQSGRQIICFVIGGYGKTSFIEKYEECRPYLEQKLSKELVDEIIKYASTRNCRDVEIEEKTFYEGNYKITVAAEYDTSIIICYK